MNSQTQQLVQYIQQQLKQGRSEDVVRNELEQSGWQKDAIDNAFQWIWQQSSAVTVSDSSAALPAPSDNPNTAPRSSNRGFKVLLIMALLLILLLAAMLIVLPKLTKSSADQNKGQTQQNTTNTTKASANSPSEEQASDNNKRDSDAASVASAVSVFQNNNLGQLPQSVGKGDQSDTVKMCGDSCTGSSTNNDAILAFYTYSGISIKSYSSGLAKPTLKELFIVNGAVCNTDKTWVTTPTEQQSSSRIVAFLYAKQSGSKTTYSCADL